MEILAIVAALVIVYAIYEKVMGTRLNAKIKQFNEERAAAIALDEELKRVRKESTRATIDFESALKEHRARFGGGRNNNDDPPPDRPAS